MAGEIYFDGKRWHLLAAGVLTVLYLALILYVLFSKDFTTHSSANSVPPTQGSKKKSH